MKLATLFQHYTAMDFDLDIAMEAEKHLCSTAEQAIEWAKATILEGRSGDTNWTESTFDDGVMQGRSLVFQMSTECNEYGQEEENLLFVQDIKAL